MGDSLIFFRGRPVSVTCRAATDRFFPNGDDLCSKTNFVGPRKQNLRGLYRVNVGDSTSKWRGGKAGKRGEQMFYGSERHHRAYFAGLLSPERPALSGL